MSNGKYETAIEELEELKKDHYLEVNQATVGVCYKELGQYDEALKFLITDSEGYGLGLVRPKVELSCCYIMKG